MVANYTPHQYFRFGGPWGPEGWSCGLRLQITAPLFDNDAQVSENAAQRLETPLKDWWNLVKNRVPYGGGLSWLSVNHIGRDGKYTNKQSFTREFTAIMGTGGNISNQGFPGPDVAMVASLTTEVKRGYANKGRVYLPTTCLGIGYQATNTFGTWDTTVRETLASQFADFLSAVNDAGSVGVPSMDIAVCVFSPGTGKFQDPSKQGDYHPVTGVRIGLQPDTQRRRLNKQDDMWGTGVVTHNVAS
jgi:hypothetical protein